jgi:hypothetical protein
MCSTRSGQFWPARTALACRPSCCFCTRSVLLLFHPCFLPLLPHSRCSIRPMWRWQVTKLLDRAKVRREDVVTHPIHTLSKSSVCAMLARVVSLVRSAHWSCVLDADGQTFIRVGTCGGVGVKPGTQVISCGCPCAVVPSAWLGVVRSCQRFALPALCVLLCIVRRCQGLAARASRKSHFALRARDSPERIIRCRCGHILLPRSGDHAPRRQRRAATRAQGDRAGPAAHLLVRAGQSLRSVSWSLCCSAVLPSYMLLRLCGVAVLPSSQSV